MMQLKQDMQTPLVVFVIINWNQAEMTVECLASLENQDYSNHRVIVVDNGSEDGSPDILRERFPYVTILETGDNLGYSLGNNVGIQEALKTEANYIMLLNNDTVVDSQMLCRLVDFAETDKRIGMVGPTMYYENPPNVVWGGANYIDWRRGLAIRSEMGKAKEIEEICEVGVPQEADYIDTCAILVKREVIEKIGLMNGNYFINFDDKDWNLRAHKAGYKVFYLPSAFMWHKVSASMGLASPATTYYMTRNALMFFWGNAPGIWKILAPMQIILRTLRSITAWTFKSQYHTRIFQKKRDANLFALRDFFLKRYGKMGPVVAEVCYGK